MTAALRVGVVGGGLIAQAVHLPNLAARPDLFSIAAIADPSPRLRAALAERYAPATVHARWEGMLERERLDALVVCSPHATHVEVVLAGLDLGLHAFVEKPLCIAPADADALARRARVADRVVQVGYMKRYHRGYASFVDALPEHADALRMVDVITYDPWMAREPFVPWSSMTPADDVPVEAAARVGAQEREQVGRAVGADDPWSVRAYSYTFLACLVHDVNLVHGALDRLGVGEAVVPLHAATWADGDAAAIELGLPGGARWRSSWMLLRGLSDFEEQARVYLDDAIHELTLPVPYHVDAPVVHRVLGTKDGASAARERSFVDDPYAAELKRFHECVTAGAECPTPPEQAARDIAVLRDLFLHCDRDVSPAARPLSAVRA